MLQDKHFLHLDKICFLILSTLLTFVLPSPTQNNAGYGLLLTPCFYGTSCNFRHRDELFTDSGVGSATLI